METNAVICFASDYMEGAHPAILERLKAFTTDMKDQVMAKDAKLADVGYENY